MKGNGIKQPRSDAMLLAGYYLSRCSVHNAAGRTKPPSALGKATWCAAYDLFHQHIGRDRPAERFRNSLRNTRDAFDAIFANGRRGWVDRDGSALLMNDRLAAIHDCWKDYDDDALESAVLAQLNAGGTTSPPRQRPWNASFHLPRKR